MQVGLLRATEARTIATITSDELGRFAFTGLTPGRYALDLASAGQPAHRVPAFELRASETVDISIRFSPVPTPAAIVVSTRSVSFGSLIGDESLNGLPNTRRVWSILENQQPSTIAEPLDLGGLETGTLPLFGALAASWTENQYQLNGMNITDPYCTGRPLLDPDLDSLTAIDVLSGAKPAEFAGAGTNVLQQTPGGSERLHLTGRVFYSNGALQSSNMDSSLAAFGFPGPEVARHLFDASFHAAGTMRNGHPFFVSVATQQLSKTVGGFPVPVDGSANGVLATVRAIERPRMRLDLLYAGQKMFDSSAGAGLQTDPFAVPRVTQLSHLIQASWRYSLGETSTLALNLGIAHAHLSSDSQEDVSAFATVDLPAMTRTGSPPLQLSGTRTRYELNLAMQTLRESAVGSHSLTLGGHLERSSIANRRDISGGIEQILVNGVGSQIVQWNTPTENSEHVQDIALYLQDDWRPAERLIVPIGLRVTTSSGSAADAGNVIRWTTLEPRLGVVLPLRNHTTTLLGSWSRYGHLLQGRYLDFGDPNAPGSRSFDWHDANNDRQFQPDELGPLISRNGGPYSGMDPNLKRPVTDEISVGVRQKFGKDLNASVRFFRRDDHNLIGLANPGVPFSSYTPVTVVDPGNDGIAGTSDDNLVTLYNRDPAFLGKDFLVLTNPSGETSSFKGFQIELSRSFAGSWQVSVSFAAMKSSGATNPGNSFLENDTGVVGSLGSDPNTLILAKGTTFFDRGFTGKLMAEYRAPGNFQIAVVARYYDGLPFGRLLFVNGFNQGPFFVRATPRDSYPDGFRTEFNGTLDLRVAREFAFRENHVTVYVDCFNLLNMNNNTKESALTGPSFSQRIPLAIQAPRLVRLGFEWKL